MSKWGHAIRATVFGVAISACAAATEGLAADMPLFGGDPTPQTKVEFGTGWYIRADLAYAYDSMPAILPDLTVASTAPQSTYSGGLGMGYKFNNWIRADLVGDYRQPTKASGVSGSITCVTQLTNATNPVTLLPIVVTTATDNCTGLGSATIQRWDLLPNVYIDLGTWYGVTPYVGAGAGLSFTQVKSSTNWYMSNGLPYHVSTDGFYFNLDSATQNLTYQFAWALMAGVAYQLTDNAFIDVGYRYVNLGSITIPSAVTGLPVKIKENVQEFRFGIRYMIDGMGSLL
jgi:opacity protein-like surface antigen